MQVTTYTQTNKIVFWMLFTVSVAFACVYAWCANNMMVATMNHKKVEARTAEISANMAELEARYAALEDGVSRDTALALGYIESGDTAFVARVSDSAVAAR